jgi:hypothetical protein
MSRDAQATADDGHLDVRAFFERYREALSALDLDNLVSVYRLPLPVVRPDRTRLVEDAATLRTEIGRILDFYRWSGMQTVEIGAFRTHGFDVGMDIVSLTWLPLTAAGAEIARIDATFAVRRVRSGARIAAVIAHNEERHRQPILRSALGQQEAPHERILRPLP